MKYTKVYEEWIKCILTLADFKNIKVGTKVKYSGSKFDVEENDGTTLTLKHESGKTITVNYNMFKKDGRQLIEESLVFNYDNGNPSLISKEILEIVKKALPKNILDQIESVTPNSWEENMISPPTISKKGVGVGSNNYKTIDLLFKTPIGHNKVTSLTIGLRKRTSGPGTGYLAIRGTKENNYVLLDDKPEHSVAIEFMEWETHEGSVPKLKELFDKEILKYLQK